MPRYVIINDSHSLVTLPDPLNGSVKPRSNLVVHTQATNFDTPAMQALLQKGILRMTVTVETPTISDHIEIPVVDMLGSGGTGNLTWKGPWAFPTSYSTYDVVQYGGQSWVATAPSTGSTPFLGSAFWTPLSESLVWRGPWGALTAYAVYDVVFYGGTSWVALAPSTGVTPVAGPFWAPMSTPVSPTSAGWNRIGIRLIPTGNPRVYDVPETFYHMAGELTIEVFHQGGGRRLQQTSVADPSLGDYIVVESGGAGTGYDQVRMLTFNPHGLVANYRAA
jgi:hypothetical protein